MVQISGWASAQKQKIICNNFEISASSRGIQAIEQLEDCFGVWLACGHLCWYFFAVWRSSAESKEFFDG